MLLAALCCLWPLTVFGQIFRYQDEYGNWHFTDDPPERYESSVVPDIATTKTPTRNAEPASDLAARLQSTFNPLTPIAYATLAVVSIKTDSGEGSGFFCSEEGYILTNKHVVRPDSTDGLDEREQDLADREQKLQAIEANLKKSRGQLRLMKEDLESFDALITDARDDQTRARAEDAHKHLLQRFRAERDRVSSMERSVRTLKTDLRKSRLNLDHGPSSASTKRRFDIVLKDGTELVADLLEISDDQDLALLKLDGYRTPFLRLGSSQPLSQGTRVYAIGNPLGMQDAVTSGVVTQITSEYLLTDAQLLPGSSGGPLIHENGEVIGINASRKVAAGTPQYAAGFGKAIPIALAMHAFPVLLNKSGTRSFDPVSPAYPGPSQAGSFVPPLFESDGPMQSGTLGLDPGGTSDAAPVRLVVPDENNGLDLDAPSEQESRSLDFPPEGSWRGGPPGISVPGE